MTNTSKQLLDDVQAVQEILGVLIVQTVNSIQLNLLNLIEQRCSAQPFILKIKSVLDTIVSPLLGDIVNLLEVKLF